MGGITDTVVSGPFAIAALLALAAGLVSFASPCVVPLVPGYLAYLVGLVGSETSTLPAHGRVSVAHGSGVQTVATAPRIVRWRAVGAAGLFVAGFTVVFVAESALVLGVYTSLIANQALLVQLSGAVSIVMGLILALPTLQREWRPRIRAKRTGAADNGDPGGAGSRRSADRLWGAPILGAAFGTGWLACTSPTLAGIIALSTATEWNGSAARGLVLVVLYCAGLGIPFLLLALGFGWAGSALAFLRSHARGIQLGGAIALVAIGVAMLTGLWGYLLAPLQGTVLLL